MVRSFFLSSTERQNSGTEHLGVSGGECLVSVMRTTGA